MGPQAQLLSSDAQKDMTAATAIIISLFALFICCPTTLAQDETWLELNLRLSPSISATQIAKIAAISEPIIYETASDESLADICAKRYGTRNRMRPALKALNQALVSEMQNKNKDFFSQSLPPGTVVLLPALSKLITSVTLEVPTKGNFFRRILYYAQLFYWEAGPKTWGDIKKANPHLEETPSEESRPTPPEGGTKKVVLPSVPTFHSLKVPAVKESEALNVLASLPKNQGFGNLVKPSYIEEEVVSPCSVSEDVTDDWFVKPTDKSAISRLKLDKLNIAVLDSGIDYQHNAFKHDLWDGSDIDLPDLRLVLQRTVGIDFTSTPQSNDIRDSTPNSHGTHVSGIASGAALVRALQLPAPQTLSKITVIPLKVAKDNKHVSLEAIEDAIQFAEAQQAKIISASWNVQGNLNAAGKNLLEDQMKHGSGVLFVFAAGNGIKQGDSYQGRNLEDREVCPPCFQLENAITVGALAASGEPAEFSNFGKQVQIFAPGCGINSTVRGNAYGRNTGTSFAAPFVSFTAALIWAQNRDLSPKKVKERILQTADPKKPPADRSAAGILNILNIAKAISVKQDLIETTNGYIYGEVLDPTIAIAAEDETCEEVDPISRNKLVRLYRNYLDSGKDVAVKKNGELTVGRICSKAEAINFKHESGKKEPIPLTQIRDVVFRMK